MQMHLQKRVSLKAKLEVMKAKVAGEDTEKPMPLKAKGKESNYVNKTFIVVISHHLDNVLIVKK